MDRSFNVEDYLRTLRATKPPWECPKCQKLYKSYSGMEYHLLNFDHTQQQTPTQKPVPSSRKSKLKFSKKKKNSRFSRRSCSPIEFKTPTRDTLTWAEAQRMVEVESEGKIYRLNINEKLDIISDSDIDKDDDSSTSNEGLSDVTECNNSSKSKKIPNIKHGSPGTESALSGKASGSINSKDLKNVTLPMAKYANENKPNTNGSTITNSPMKLPKPSFRLLPDYEKETLDAPQRSSAYYRYIEKPAEDLEEEVEYDMDEEDAVWLELMNEQRSIEGLSEVTHSQLELLMDRFEKESYFEQAKNGPGNQGTQPLIDEDAVCCVCNDGECQNSNVILFCDMCNLAVHQECYGVPYIPEGQWLCRRCLQSPSCPVDCCLCPSKSGAFKQTDDNRWAHVVCALWVPEVGFGNTVFLEPIDGLKNIPPARWRLTCYLCKQRNVGACIQCHRTNCYTAFHVTCAQQAGLYMKMEPVRESGRNGVTVTVKKEAYCDVHTPLNASPRQNKLNGQLVFKSEEKKSSDKMKKTRKILAEKRHELPHIAIPYIPRDKISSIGRHINIQKKSSFMQRLLSYWTLKRQSRNGVPLLRRLQSHVHSHKPHDPEAESQQHILIEQLKYWQRLRHDLERARLLVELIRKREKLKRETIRISQALSDIKLIPFLVLLRRVLSELQDIDVAQVFAEPVKTKEAPDYHKVIKNPMDFSTMAAKIDSQRYKTYEQFEDDFNLLVENCLLYNNRDTIFYRLAVKMRDHGGAVMRAAKREIEATGFDVDTGMLLPKTPQKVEMEVIDEETRLKLPLKEQLGIMYDRLDQAVLNSRKTKKIKTEISAIKRKIFQETHKQIKAPSENKNSFSKTTVRRFSADDAEITSATENEAVVSDVGSGFKVSPKIRPLSSKRAPGGRKRLWSARPSLDFSSEPLTKKSHLERSESCPMPNESVVQCERLSLQDLGKLNEPNSMDTNQIDNKTSCSNEFSAKSSSKPNLTKQSSSCSVNSSVSRRTAVLFKKKPRRRLSNVNKTETDSSPSLNGTFPIAKVSTVKAASSGTLPPTEAKRTRSTSGYGLNDVYEDQPFSNATDDNPKTKERLSNGLDSLQDESVFKEKHSFRRRDSFRIYREEFTSARSTSDSDTTSSVGSANGTSNESGRKKKTPKKKRSYSCSVGTSNMFCQSDVASSETSNEDRPGLILGDGFGMEDHFRKQSGASATEDEMEEDDLPHINPLDLVWAKCRGYPPYPALLIDPKMPRTGFSHNGVPIPVPPLDVLQVGDKRIENGNHRIFLVLFFDTKRTWQWLPRNKLELLGKDPRSDQVKLSEGRRPALRKNVEAAYNRALLHRSRVTGEIPDSDDDVSTHEVNTDSDSQD